MAASDALVSGKYGCAKIGAAGAAEGAASSLYEVTAWQYNEALEDVTYASCETDGQKARIDGSYDITGTISVVYNSDQPFRSQVAVGDTAVLYLYKRKPLSGVTGIFDRIPVKVLSISGGIDIEAGGPERFEIGWGLNITQTDPVVEFDQSAPALP